MKIKNIIITAVAASLSLGLSTFALTKGTTLVESKANYDDYTSVVSGYFERVTNPATLGDNEQLLMVGGQNAAFRYHVGASYHYWVTTERSGFDIYSHDYIYLNNSKIELITFKKNENGSFYLYLPTYASNLSREAEGTSSGYIVHEGYNNNGVTAFGDLYIRHDINKPSAAAAQWYLEYTDDSMRITTSEGDDSRLLMWKSSGSSSYSWDSFIASTHREWTSNINLYRRVTPQSEVTFTTYLDSNEYGLKDTLRTNNMFVHFLLPSPAEAGAYRSVSLYVNECPRFFEIDTEIDYEEAGVYERTIKYKPNNTEFKFNITVIDAEYHHFSKVRSDEKDYRGTYLAIAEQSGMVYDSGNDHEYQSSNGKAISVGNGLDTYYHTLDTTNFELYRYYAFNDRISAPFDAAFTITLDTSNPVLGTYYMRNYENTSYYGYSEINLDEYNSYIATNSGMWPVTITNATLTMNNLTFKYNKTEHRFGLTNVADGSTWETAVLYRLDLNDEIIAEADYYRENNFSYLRDNTCQMDGSTDGDALKSAWNGIQYKYYNDVCSPDAQYYLSNLIYTHGTHDKDTNESMVDCYDYILNKYSEKYPQLNDFMFRRITGAYQENSSKVIAQNNVLMGDNKVAIILVATSILSISVVGAALLIKKRKEQY